MAKRVRKSYPAWIKCPDCGEFWCTNHLVHTSESECKCPPIEDWKIDPYVTGGQPITLRRRPNHA